VYSQQAKDDQLLKHARDIRERAEIRAGELLREMAQRGERHSGKNVENLRGSRVATPAAPKLSDLGISKSQSSRWQQRANAAKGKPRKKKPEKISQLYGITPMNSREV
jgi:hypothetical protein